MAGTSIAEGWSFAVIGDPPSTEISSASMFGKRPESARLEIPRRGMLGVVPGWLIEIRRIFEEAPLIIGIRTVLLGGMAYGGFSAGFRFAPDCRAEREAALAASIASAKCPSAGVVAG